MLTGLRAAELRALTWGNVDFKTGQIHVRRMAVGRDTLEPVKPRAARRSVALAPAVAEVLRGWRAAQKDAPLNLVFPGKDGRVMDGAMIQRCPFARLQKRCGVVDGDGKARYRFDDLRHAAAALYIEPGWPARKLRDMVGEASDAAVARRYAALFERAGDDRAALELIAARLFETP